MRHRRNTKKRGTQPFFCRPAWFLRTQQSALQWGGGKTVCGHQAWSPSFSGVHPIPRPRPPFPRYYCVNAQSNISYLEPGRIGPLRGEARKIRSGRNLGTYEVRITDADGTLVAVATVTGFLTKHPIPAEEASGGGEA